MLCLPIKCVLSAERALSFVLSVQGSSREQGWPRSHQGFLRKLSVVWGNVAALLDKPSAGVVAYLEFFFRDTLCPMRYRSSLSVSWMVLHGNVFGGTISMYSKWWHEFTNADLRFS